MKTHRFDALSFAAGLVITAIGLAFLLIPDVEDVFDFVTDAGAWFWPVVLIAVGLAILIPLVTPTGDQEAPEEAEDTEVQAS